MSSTWSHESRVMLAELLLVEKDVTRVWLRAEMDRLVDPMLDSIFNRLQTKLTNGLEQTKSGDGDRCAQLNSSDREDHPNFQAHHYNQQLVHDDESDEMYMQHNPSMDYQHLGPNGGDIQLTDDYGHETNNTDNVTSQLDYYSAEVKEEFDDSTTSPITSNQAQCSVPLSASSSNEQSSHNLTNHNSDDEDKCACENCTNGVEVKEEVEDGLGDFGSYQLPENYSANIEPAHNSIAHSITDPLNVQFEAQLNDHSINSSSSAQESTLIPSTSTDQTLHKTEIQLQQPQQLVFNDHSENVDDNYVNGDQNDGQESIPPMKRPRMDSTQPNNAQSEASELCQKQPTEDAQPNQVIDHDMSDNEIVDNQQIITVHLRCPESECPKTFAETELNDHLMDEHSIGPNRCVIKDCKQSFDNPQTLGKHFRQFHQSTTQLHCDKCSKHFNKYPQLSVHNIQYHQLGHFQCSFPSCTFTGEFRKKVFSHYRKHKLDIVCPQSGCGYRTKNFTRLKAHERGHLGVKPYRCTWQNCHYSNESQNNTMIHIRKVHFKSKASPELTHLGKPKDYLEVVPEL